MRKPILVVGAGFAGTVVARRLADAGKQVIVIDKREHVGGNAYDSHDSHGILIHNYGPHIFHTNSQRVVDFLSQFTEWQDYVHRSQMYVGGKLVPFPVNLDTYDRLGISHAPVDWAPYGVQSGTALEYQYKHMGIAMTELLSRPYTLKQWDLDLTQLAASVVARNPPRQTRDARTFLDEFQKMPKDGYTKMFLRMLDHPNIRLSLGQRWYHTVSSPKGTWEHVIYTGPIDEYFEHRFGKLPYRSMRFDHVHFEDRDYVQSVGTVGYPDLAIPFTRSTEHKHLTGQLCRGTTVTYEHSAAEGEPFYPIPRPDNEQLYRRYRELAKDEKGVTFVGRLATYKYLNMDQVVAQALKTADRLLGIEMDLQGVEP